MIDIAHYQAQVYPDPPCWALVADVYRRELGEGVDGYKTINGSVREIARAFRLHLHKSPHGFTQLDEPTELCVVLMAKSSRLGMHHAGIYTDGAVLHAMPEGVYWQDMTTIRDAYPIIEFWGRL